MKNFPQGIFQTLDWLMKEFKKMLYKLTNLESTVASLQTSKLSSVEVDGITTQGNGILGNPVKSLMLSQVYEMSDGGSLTLADFPTKTVFLVNQDLGVPPTGSTGIVFPTVVDGLRLIIMNNTGFGMTVSGSGTPILNAAGATYTTNLDNSKTYEVIGINGNWYILSKFPE